MDVYGLVMIVAIITLGILLKWTWLALIGAILLLGYIYVSAQKKPAPSGGTGKPKIRPIIVKRKYAVDSIYPSKMAIKLVPNWYTGKWWELGLETMGTFLGKLTQKVKK